MFAENRLAPFMGSTVCEDFAGEDGADAAATWVVLKACVAEWELRLRCGDCRRPLRSWAVAHGRDQKAKQLTGGAFLDVMDFFFLLFSVSAWCRVCDR